ncbi:ATP-dependent DNA helicase Q4-like isoform X2 [Mercenaria mercenaria]|uniref:ATP-dependent DNA helicase Q4-like isoform X2 n=1 Tax=Mercenaria mercenaria TaxID=6596 RepID=UPI00234EAC8A|nr:ATP-dependent DNA helicase Q4-like isoform X2 [Mercenaria mercenaria]
MADAVEIKKVLKQWETEFWKEHGRKPNKTDIDSAPGDIKETYVKYTKLKKSAPSSGKVAAKEDNSNSEKTVPRTANVPTESSEQNVQDIDKGKITNENLDMKKEGIDENSDSNKGEVTNENLGMTEANDKNSADKVEVWGSQFDRKVTKIEDTTSGKERQTGGNKPSFLKHLGEKMYQQSLKLNKGQVTKPSAKLWRKPDTPRPIKPYKPDSESADSLSDKLESAAVKTGADEVDGSFNPAGEQKHANFGKVFEKALSISKHKGTIQGSDTDSDVFMNKYQTKAKPKQSFLPSNLSSLISKHRQEMVIEEEFENEEFVVDNKTDFNDDDDNDEETGGHSWNVPVSKLIRDDEKEAVKKSKRNNGKKDSDSENAKRTWKKVSSENVDETDFPAVKSKDKGRTGIEKQNSENVSGFSLSNKVSSGSGVEADDSRSKPQQKKMIRSKSCDEKDTDVEDNFDTFEFDDGSDSDSPKQKPKRKTAAKSAKAKGATRAKKTAKRKANNSEEDIEEKSVQNSDASDDAEESGVKKRKKVLKSQPAAKKRKTNAGSVAVDDDGQVATSTVVKKPTRAKAISNDNFIKLNMKIKTYKRKGRHMTGPQYKRKMWKEKMQARSKSYGDACFKCGQSGHWANKCPGGQSKSHYDKEPVQDEDFPSMQEAAMMAKGCQVQKSVKTEAKVRESQEKLADEHSETVPPDVTALDEEDIDLEIQSGIVRSRPDTATAPPAMKPLIECGEEENVPETPDFVLKGLRKFGFDCFRPGQEEAVMRILCGLSTLVVLSTGGGKSLCYQLPAYLYSQRSTCITLVISPLVSLMEDQVTGLPNGIRGVCLHTNMTAHQRENVLEAVKSGKAQFLLVSPEAIAGGSMSLIASMSSLPPVAFVCIDEAHCLSEWSHNFRPSYLRLCKVLQEKVGVQCFLGLTATATLSTASDVARHLKISDFKKATVRGSPIPANLILSVSRDESREQALIGLLKGERFGNLDSIIIYCTRRDQTDKVATIIRTCMNTGAPAEKLVSKGRGKRPKLEWDAESYHAGLTAAQRKRVQNAFMAGKLRVVVATVAFGMGLDKSDVRGVIHYNMPKSFESYVQEIGRAGRDGERAECHVFLDPEGKDLCELRRHTYANTVDYRTLKKLVQKVLPPCRCRDVHERHAQAKLEAEMFDDDFDMDTLDEPSKPDTEATMEIDGQSGQNTSVNNSGSSESGPGLETSEKNATEKARLCPGHERALPIQETVMDLDVKEEGISTLLCYLELHSSQWLENMSNVYASCKVQCYGGPSQLQAIAKKCPPVAVAIASARKDGKNFSNANSIEFRVVDVSDTMGWDSGPVKKEIKLLQWSFDSGGPKRTGIMVEFSDLAYHFRTPGDFTTEELDDILQFLHERIQRQEKSEIRNLSCLYQALKSVSHRNHWMCSDEADMSKNDKLKVILNQYFDQQLVNVEDDQKEMQDEPIPEFSHGQLVTDIRAFYNLYGQEHSLNGRAIARIFHGIASPCFPATTWGRVRRFWRSHLDVDFNTLMKIATKELISFR